MSDILNAPNKTSILHIPPNVMITIFGYLDLKSLCLTTRVCRSWHSYANDPSLWKILDLTPYQYNVRELKKIINRRISENTRELRIKGHITATKKLDNLSIPLLAEIKKKAPGLSGLSLCYCDLKSIDVTSLPGNITKLCLSHSLVPLRWFEALKTNNSFPFIQDLDISFCTRISSEDITSISNLLTLKTLTLSGCYRVIDNDILSIVTKLKSIIYLDINDCKRVTDVSLHHIAQHLKDLEKLHLRNCHLITPLGLVSLKDGVINLDYLDLVGCTDVTCAEASMIFSNCIKLTINTFDATTI